MRVRLLPKEKTRVNKMKKYRIMFVCLGNICRSPMAEFICKDMVKKAGREDEFEVYQHQCIINTEAYVLAIIINT